VKGRHAGLAALAALTLVALCLRLWPLGHGLPANYVPDTHVVRSALGMARDRDPVPPVGRYSTYPNLIPYMLLPLYAVQFGVGRVRGEWDSADAFAQRVIEQPARVHWTARLLVSLFGALTVWVTFRAARAADLRAGAWVAAWLVATGLLHVQLSTHERPWVPVLFFGALTLWGCIAFARSGRARALVGAGAAAGLAFACHQAGLFFLLLCALAWWHHGGGWSGPALKRRLVVGCACVAACLVLGVAIGHPYYLRYGLVPPQEVAGFGSADAQYVSIGGQALRFGASLDSFRRLSMALVGYDPVLLLLGLLGFMPALRGRGTRVPALFTLIYAAFFLFNPSDHVRYLLPLTVLLALPAGIFAQWLITRPAGRLALAVLCALPLVQALRLGYVLRQEDTRAEALHWLAELGPDARVAIDHYGPQVELSLPALERLAARRELRIRERQRLEHLRSGATGGIDAVPVEDLFWVDPVSGEYGVRPEQRAGAQGPSGMFEALGVTHFVMVNRRPVRPSEPFLSQATSAWKLARSLDPSGNGRAAEAFLPTEMDFPLTAIWSVTRPGPRLELYELR
jgi:hypothetical protein